ncbi:MAG: hypothetical protein IT173_00505 [Acidobacteria bacterium]|nr:hypothetical protein [Acidobacteriota bacterium]
MIQKNLRSFILILAAAAFMAGAFAASRASIDHAAKDNPFAIYHGSEEMNYYDLAAVLSIVFSSSCLAAAFMLLRKRS